MRFASPEERLPPAERLCRETERWLEDALAGRIQVPRIPVRRADRGGFDELLATAGGRAAINAWWACTFDALES